MPVKQVGCQAWEECWRSGRGTKCLPGSGGALKGGRGIKRVPSTGRRDGRWSRDFFVYPAVRWCTGWGETGRRAQSGVSVPGCVVAELMQDCMDERQQVSSHGCAGTTASAMGALLRQQARSSSWKHCSVGCPLECSETVEWSC